MSKIVRRIGAGTATLALAGGLLATGVPQASAWDGVYTMSAAEVKDKEAMMHGTVLACNLLPKGWSTVCSFAGSRATSKEIKDAAMKGCGLTVKWRATGSGNSWDKAEYEYTENC